MSSIRIGSGSNFNYANLPTTGQTGSGTAGSAGSSGSVSGSSGYVPSSNVNLFDNSVRQAAAQALIALTKSSSSITLPSSSSDSSSDWSDDQSGDDTSWSGGIAALPSSLQGLSTNDQSTINSAAANIASAIYNTPLSQLQAYNQQYATASTGGVSATGGSSAASAWRNGTAAITGTASASSNVTSSSDVDVASILQTLAAATQAVQSVSPSSASSAAVTGVASKAVTGQVNTADISGTGSAITSVTSGLDANNNGVVTANSSAPNLSGVSTVNTSGSTDTSSVTSVMMMGVEGLQQQLSDYAQYVYGNQQNENQISTDNQELSQAIADWPSDSNATQTFTWHYVGDNGALSSSTASLNLEQAKELQASLSDTLTSMSDQSQTDQLKLQSMSQQYQEGITTISNMLSMQYNTIKNTLQNIHY